MTVRKLCCSLSSPKRRLLARRRHLSILFNSAVARGCRPPPDFLEGRLCVVERRHERIHALALVVHALSAHALTPHGLKRLAQALGDVDVRVEHLLPRASVPVEQILERELVELLRRHHLRPCHRERVVFEGSRRVWLVREVDPLAVVRMEEVGDAAVHGEGREGEHVAALGRDEAEEDHREHVRGDIGGGGGGADGGEREGGVRSRDEATLAAYGCGRGVKIDEREHRSPKRNKVDALHHRDAVVKRDSCERKGFGNGGGRRKEHERREQLESDGRGSHRCEDQPRVREHEALERVRQRSRQAESVVRVRLSHVHSLKDVRLQSTSVPPCAPAFDGGDGLREPGTAVRRYHNHLDEPDCKGGGPRDLRVHRLAVAARDRRGAER
mmetsp:Transcript_3529/g.12655  ORF Transcript_3529/g.12655 Transcript_3529/m.12655 type:complete len:385 (-) Transcript_3529:329-1483(-)